MEALGVHHVDLRVTDYERSVRFYDRFLLPLGFTKTGVDGETVTYYVRHETAIGVRPIKKRGISNVRYSYERAGIHHLGVAVKKKEDVDAFYTLLKTRRMTVLHPPKNYPQYSKQYYSVYFLDPDGIELEILFWG